MISSLVDFHCHLDLYPNHERVFKEREKSGIFTLSVTTTPKAWTHNYNLARKTTFVRSALGLHPQIVKGTMAKELALWDKYLPDARYIGEVGLDAGREYENYLSDQVEVFKHILTSCSKVGGKILSVHAVNSIDLVMDMIEQYLPNDRGRVVIHWFSGSAKQMKRAVGLGCYFSVNTAMTRTLRGKEALRLIPIQKLLTETDGPFTGDVRNSPAQPNDMIKLLTEIAQLRSVPSSKVRESVVANFKELLI